MACLSCGKWHLPLEGCHQGDTSAGLALRDRLAKARAALAGERVVDILAPIEAAPEPVKPRPVAVKSQGEGQPAPKGKGGRPAGPTPWKDRRAAHLRSYKRAYMRTYRARKAAPQG